MISSVITFNLMPQLATIQTNLAMLNRLSGSEQNQAVSLCMDLARQGAKSSHSVNGPIINLLNAMTALRSRYPEHDTRLIQAASTDGHLGVGFCFDQWGDASGLYWGALILADTVYTDVPILRADPVFNQAWAHLLDVTKAEIFSPKAL